jgi:putative oligomerization/nucleic acid binding protein
MPGLVRGVAKTAVVAGTATAVSGRVARRQAGRWADQEQQQAPAEQAPPPPPPPPAYQAPPPPPPPPPQQVVVMQQPAEAAMDAKLAQLQQLAELKAQGVLSDAEFEAQKGKILNS